MCAVVGIPLFAGWLWTRHADAVKAASKATAFLTSSELTTWNYGTLDQRLALGHWATIGDRIRELLLGGWIWVPLLLVLLWQARKLGFWLGWLLTIVLPIAVFFNLFWIHDYYLAAISPAIAGRSVSESTSCTPTSASGWRWSRV